MKENQVPFREDFIVPAKGKPLYFENHFYSLRALDGQNEERKTGVRHEIESNTGVKIDSLLRTLYIWKRLSEPQIATFLGVSTTTAHMMLKDASVQGRRDGWKNTKREEFLIKPRTTVKL